jgi:hypothetical protein
MLGLRGNGKFAEIGVNERRIRLTVSIRRLGPTGDYRHA